MKQFNTKMLLLIFSILINYYSNAQDWNWVDYKVTGSKSSYNCSKHKTRNEAIYVNQKYNKTEILKEYPGYSNVDPSFLGYKTDLHNSFLEVIKKSINTEKLKSLADRNEGFYVGFDLNQDGKLLRIIFVLDTATIITSDELYSLEENIKNILVFKPIRKVEVKLMDGFGITTNFKEILNGEILSIRRTEEQQRETERLYGN
ncbi:MAG: hypothetical protein F9K37_04195 [Bacteroidales bacterium]|nr:MAG: hypothetical protein F9K37_04195 [Bacteroidales bacterium]